MDAGLEALTADSAGEPAGTAGSDSPSELYTMLCAVTKEEQGVNDALSSCRSACEKLRSQIVEEEAKTAMKRDRLPSLCDSIEVEQTNKLTWEACMRGVATVLADAKLSMDKAEQNLEAICAGDGIGLSEWTHIYGSDHTSGSEALFATPSEVFCLLSSLRKKTSNVCAMMKFQQENEEKYSNSNKCGGVECFTASPCASSRLSETDAAVGCTDGSDAATIVVVGGVCSSQRRRLHFDDDCLEKVTQVRTEPACGIQRIHQKTYARVGSTALPNVGEATTPNGLLVSTTRVLWSSAGRHGRPNVTKWVYYNPKHSS
ncbi:unnamed protein product [Phytomonas sp. Hart1]|nr:unnamed protein product [Phytomonas sp. Hart1]|eukprot:CCW70574.1 unnamed protein product [Phytomonas sp. isolate Hart1]